MLATIANITTNLYNFGKIKALVKNIKMKILFIVSDFDMGGITSSLRNFSELLIKKGHEVHVLNLPKKELPEDFDPKIELIELEGRSRYWDITAESVFKAKGLKKVKLLFIGILKKILNKDGKWNKFIFKKSFWMGYDVVVGFRQSPICFYLTTEKTDALRKLGFWHGDIHSENVASWMHYSYSLDKLACVSNAVAEGIEEKYPLLKGKTCTVYNVFNGEAIKALAVEPFEGYEENIFNIVTVARVDFVQKQLDWIPIICEKLKKDGFCFRWYIVGDGPDLKKLCDLITEHQVEDVVLVCGRQVNPYPYIKNAQLFSLLSSWEAYGMVVMEALICGTPVVSAYYPALSEILDNEKNGIISENSMDGVYRAVKKVLQDKELYNHLKANCIEYKYSNDEVYKSFLEAVK